MCSKFQQFSEFETMSSEICFSDCSVLNVTTCEELAPPKLHKVKKLILITELLIMQLMQLCTPNLLDDISEQLTFNSKKGEVWNKNRFDCHFHSTFDQILKKFFRSYTMKMDATQGQTTLGRKTSICIKFLFFKIISKKSMIYCLSINNFHKIGDFLIWFFAVLLFGDCFKYTNYTEMNGESRSVICEI